MAATERDLFKTTEAPQAGTGSAPTTARQLVPTSQSTTERQYMSASGQSTPPASSGSQSQTMLAPAAPTSTPPNASSGAPGPTTPPGAAPGTSLAPVVSQPVLSQVQQNETVSGQLQELLKSGSPLLESSRNRAIVQASARGLQNSTLASQAGEEAFLSTAVPIAATDAATYAQRATGNQAAQNQFGQNQQQFEHQQQLSVQDHLQRVFEQAQAGDINSRLQLEQAGYNSALSAQENLQRLEQLSKEGDIQSTLALQQFNYATMRAAQDQGYALELGNQQFQNSQSLLIEEYARRGALSTQEAQQELTRLNQLHENTIAEITAQSQINGGADAAKWARDLQQGYLNAVTQRQMQASQEIQTIYSTQGLTSAQQQLAVTQAQTRLRTDIAAIAAYFQQTPGWPGTAPASPPGTPAPPPGAPVPAPGGPIAPAPYSPTDFIGPTPQPGSPGSGGGGGGGRENQR
jgi:hypothetical protein